MATIITWVQGGGSTWKSAQNTTGTAPGGAVDGVPLKDLSYLQVIVETAVPGSQTLSGAGSLLCYIWDNENSSSPGAWSRLPSGDLAVSLSSVARQAFPPFQVAVPRNALVAFVPSGVTVSAGSTVTVYLLGFAPQSAALYGGAGTAY